MTPLDLFLPGGYCPSLGYSMGQCTSPCTQYGDMYSAFTACDARLDCVGVGRDSSSKYRVYVASSNTYQAASSAVQAFWEKGCGM